MGEVNYVTNPQHQTQTGMAEPVPTTPSAYQPAFGRKFYPNPATDYYPMSAYLNPFGKPDTKIWTPGPILNQGVEGSCVGHAFAGLLYATPHVFVSPPAPTAHQIYYEAQKIDPWRDHPHEGTTVEAAARILHGLGYLEQYVWARNGYEIAQWIVQHGPVVLGTMWFDSMNEPNELGFIKMIGEPVGGHAYLAYGFDTNLDAFLCRNSWGAAFGQNGDFYVRFSDMDILLRNFGEACAAVERMP